MKNLTPISCHFNISHADHSLFVRKNYTHIIVILVYADDIIVIGSSQEQIKKIKRQLKKMISKILIT
jgi:ribosomal protein S3